MTGKTRARLVLHAFAQRAKEAGYIEFMHVAIISDGANTKAWQRSVDLWRKSLGGENLYLTERTRAAAPGEWKVIYHVIVGGGNIDQVTELFYKTAAAQGLAIGEGCYRATKKDL